MPRTRRVDCNSPGISRVRRGHGFSYHEENGERIVEPETLERIAELAIPPAWEDVWICPVPNGHIQATGTDAAGRKQYLYHRFWRENRDREKFAEMEAFAKALPRMRERTLTDLARRRLGRERVLACAVRLLDYGLFRIGSERYADENRTFGLSTLERRHLKLERGGVRFSYVGKGDQRHEVRIAAPEVRPTLKLLKERDDDGRKLLAYRDRREWAEVSAAAINDYLREATAVECSAKDFRTWNATVLAAVALAENGHDAAATTARKRAANEATKRVAAYLGNTPAVCRSSYIDPRVFDRFDAGETIRPALRRIVAGLGPDEFPDRERIERAVLRLVAG